MEKQDKRASKNPAGYLAKSIRDDFTTPKGFKTKAQYEAERQKAKKAEQELAARRIDARSKDARELAEKAAVDAHLASLTSEQRVELEREMHAASELNPRLFGRIIVRDHVRKLLGSERRGRERGIMRWQPLPELPTRPAVTPPSGRDLVAPLLRFAPWPAPPAVRRRSLPARRLA